MLDVLLNLFMEFVLPVLMLVMILAVVMLRIRWGRGSTMLAGAFFLLAFGPSLLCSLVADDSSTELFAISIATAGVVVGILYLVGKSREKELQAAQTLEAKEAEDAAAEEKNEEMTE